MCILTVIRKMEINGNPGQASLSPDFGKEAKALTEKNIYSFQQMVTGDPASHTHKGGADTGPLPGWAPGATGPQTTAPARGTEETRARGWGRPISPEQTSFCGQFWVHHKVVCKEQRVPICPLAPHTHSLSMISVRVRRHTCYRGCTYVSIPLPLRVHSSH